MSKIKKVRYEKKCDECGEPFVASMKNARFCSSACKSRWNRKQKDVKHNTELIERDKCKKQMESILVDIDHRRKCKCIECGAVLQVQKRVDAHYIAYVCGALYSWNLAKDIKPSTIAKFFDVSKYYPEWELVK